MANRRFFVKALMVLLIMRWMQDQGIGKFEGCRRMRDDLGKAVKQGPRPALLLEV